MTREELIKALENAAGPSRELDAEIATALKLLQLGVSDADWILRNFKVWRANENGIVRAVHSDGSDGPWFKADPFTSSIDAALTLVPVGFSTHLAIMPQHLTTRAKVGHQKDSSAGVTPAIALCIAALKARGEE